MKKLILVFAAALAAGASACIFVVDGDGMHSRAAWNYDWEGEWSGDIVRGSGHAATQEREAGDFRAISIRTCADARIRVGEPASVRVTADDNLIDHVVTRVEEGVLVIEIDRGSYSFKTDIVVDVALPELDAVRISGSGDAAIEGLAGGSLELEVSGSGDVVAHGTVDSLVAAISGSGDLLLYGLRARSAKVSISGSGDVQVDVAESLSASISGSGDVRYRGSPQVQRHVAGSGSVEHD
jgi:hypothetical protein